MDCSSLVPLNHTYIQEKGETLGSILFVCFNVWNKYNSCERDYKTSYNWSNFHQSWLHENLQQVVLWFLSCTWDMITYLKWNPINSSYLSDRCTVRHVLNGTLVKFNWYSWCCGNISHKITPKLVTYADFPLQIECSAVLSLVWFGFSGEERDRGVFFLSVLREVVDRTQPYQEEQHGDTGKPLTGNYRDGYTHTHTHTSLSLST